MSRESKVGNFFHNIIVPIGNFAHVAALLLVIFEFGKHGGFNWAFWVILGVLGFTSISSFVLYFQGKKEKKFNETTVTDLNAKIKTLSENTAKNEKYKTVFPLLNNAYREIHVAIKDSPESYHEALTGFCNNLSNAFSSVTGSECHIAIKMITADKDSTATKLSSLKTITIARDNASSAQRKKKRLHGVKTAHSISENSDFLQIIKQVSSGKDPYFYSNDLVTTMPIYTNSSFKCFNQEHDVYGPYTPAEEREKSWSLEYKSTIVVPIYLGNNNSQEAGKNFYGFLCVHSNEINIFDEKIDKEILSGCADGLINVLDRCYNKTGVINAIP